MAMFPLFVAVSGSAFGVVSGFVFCQLALEVGEAHLGRIERQTRCGGGVKWEMVDFRAWPKLLGNFLEDDFTLST